MKSGLKVRLAEKKVQACVDELKEVLKDIQDCMKDGILSEDEILSYQDTCTEIFANMDKHSATLREAQEENEVVEEEQQSVMY